MATTFDVPNPGSPMGKQELAAFRAVLQLSEHDWQQVVAAFNSTPPALTLEQYTNAIESKLLIDRDLVRALVRTLADTFLAGTTSDRDVSRILQLIVNALDLAEPVEALRNDYHTAAFQQRVSTLLESSALETAFKVGRLLYENERIVQAIQITTELRPIFDDGTEELSVGSLIIHNLKIVYLQDGQTKNEFFAMHPDDVQRMRLQLSRAEAKEASLRRTLRDTSVAPLARDGNN